MFGRAYQTLFGQLNQEIARLDEGRERVEIDGAISIDDNRNRAVTPEQKQESLTYPHVLIHTTQHHVRQQDSCAICLEKYTFQEVTHMLSCQHRFHAQCIDPWLQEHKECPICKVNVFLRHD